MIKKLGQNFLIDENIAIREIKYAKISKSDTVLEIGPGKGILTDFLAKNAKQVIAIEIDNTLVKKLDKKLPSNVTLINEDVLLIDFKDLPKFNKIISNLPFQISSPITFKLLDYDFDLAILIYQKEFAERMVASPGTKKYSRLTVGVHYKSHCRILETVKKEAFQPVPDVDSCIVELKPRNIPPFKVVDEKFFFNMVKKLFNHRRKKIKNIIIDIMNFDVNIIPFSDYRVDSLKPSELGELSNILFKQINKFD